MSSQSSQSAIPTPFAGQCDNCQQARFDDSNLGGYEATSGTGRMHLQFDMDKDAEPVLECDWVLEDSLPHLPNLTTTAEAGCKFCQFLMNLLRSQDVTYLFKDILENFEVTDEVSLELFCWYTWGNSDFVLMDEHSHGNASSGLRSF
ncbi:hypothetical protein E0Z10_g2415 [Xylaria hypoxylon]|uniref:Uncharacterized protein n=1 Tax=Xylaria hypoxylon TaxID=37992 RepID=A0A4Z0Z3S8_9PEZI|nr:hypothetical protein E0Z10_g2415 [Xylaria hypoxylon]